MVISSKAVLENLKRLEIEIVQIKIRSFELIMNFKILIYHYYKKIIK